VRPFFCQVEAIETAIWLIEVAPNKGKAAQTFLDHLRDANEDANPGVMRLALEAGHGRWQNHRHGHAHCLANHQLGSCDPQAADTAVVFYSSPRA
jgi:hypothetical protein